MALGPHFGKMRMSKKLLLCVDSPYIRILSLVNVNSSFHRFLLVSEDGVHNFKLMTVPVIFNSLEDPSKLKFINKTVLLVIDYVEKFKNLG